MLEDLSHTILSTVDALHFRRFFNKWNTARARPLFLYQFLVVLHACKSTSAHCTVILMLVSTFCPLLFPGLAEKATYPPDSEY